MAEVRLLAFGWTIFDIGQAMRPSDQGHFSKRLFTQSQLLAIFCLMRYERWAFREAEVRLSQHRELRQASRLSMMPDFMMLYRFLRPLEDQTIGRAVSETVRRVCGRELSYRPRARVTVEATGLAQEAVCTYFVRRLHHHGQKPLPLRHWQKWLVVADLDQQLLVSQSTRSDPRNDCGSLPMVIKTGSRETRIGLGLADAEFDSERNHTYVVQRLGARSQISVKRGKKTWRMHGVHTKM